MKNILSLLVLMGYVSYIQSQDFLTLENAKTKAQETEATILMVFSGSDWCKPCIQLKKEILESEEFKTIEKEIIIIYLDFPYKKSNQLSQEQLNHNEALAEKYNSRGKFPKIVWLDPQENILGEPTYKKGMTPAEFISLLQ